MGLLVANEHYSVYQCPTKPCCGDDDATTAKGKHNSMRACVCVGTRMYIYVFVYMHYIYLMMGWMDLARIASILWVVNHQLR